MEWKGRRYGDSFINRQVRVDNRYSIQAGTELCQARALLWLRLSYFLTECLVVLMKYSFIQAYGFILWTATKSTPLKLDFFPFSCTHN